MLGKWLRVKWGFLKPWARYSVTVKISLIQSLKLWDTFYFWTRGEHSILSVANWGAQRPLHPPRDVKEAPGHLKAEFTRKNWLGPLSAPVRALGPVSADQIPSANLLKRWVYHSY